MAIPASVLQDWEALTEEDRRKAHGYIKALLQHRSEEQSSHSRPDYPLGIWNGESFYMADDFNDTPEGFEDYT